MSLGKPLVAEYESFVSEIEKKGFAYIGDGSFRSVYMRKNVVIKVPKNEDGVIDNRVEARSWRTARNKATRLGLYVAPSRLLPNFTLMMVKVSESMLDEIPSWCDKIDAQQVGMYKGRLVAFDYAIDTLERFLWEKEWGIESQWLPTSYYAQKHNYLKPFPRDALGRFTRHPANNNLNV